MEELYTQTAFDCSKLITKTYSTSFSLGIRTLHKRYHKPIYAIYGFVRYADEIVDTFHDYDKRMLLQRFKEDTYKSFEEKISLNPVLHSFQHVVNNYKIDHDLIEAFLVSMEMDLSKKDYADPDYKKYIYGSAEVVGLMCLKVFCGGEEKAGNVQPLHQRPGARANLLDIGLLDGGHMLGISDQRNVGPAACKAPISKCSRSQKLIGYHSLHDGL